MADKHEQEEQGQNQSEQNEKQEQNGPANDALNQQVLNGASEQLQSELQQARNDYLYLKADFENFKRNAIKERSELLKYGSERVVVEILSCLDNLDRALQGELNAQNIEAFRKGMEMIASDLRSTLQRFGVNEVPSEGQVFDPFVHEALTSEETTQVPAGHVSKVLRKPYKLHDKVIRTGQVIVAKEPTN